ncbi:MAG: ATP-grasp domain-containing protein [Bacteroidales bacterium]|nr:ATP-grasp domain-containing protein [Bacteroidales bacterium]
MTKRPELTIAVSGLNAIDSPGPGVAVIRGLKEAKSFGCRIIGLAYESLEPGIFMHDLVDKTYQIPYPSSGTESVMERLEYIHEQEKLDVIIPNFDAELYPFIRLEKRMKEMGIASFLPTMKQFEERLKVNLDEFGKQYGLKVPKGKVYHDLGALHSVGKDFEYPVLVKGKYYDAYVAYNIDQVKNYFHKITAKWGSPVILQEFVHGTEFNVTGLGDGEGNTIAAVPMRKQYITDKGKAWGGVSISDRKILELTKSFISQTKWRGGFELELMKDKNNDFYLLEINPRMPAWIYLAVGVGQNIPEALVRLALGEKVEPFTEYKVGKMFVRYAWDMIVDIEEFQQISTHGEL